MNMCAHARHEFYIKGESTVHLYIIHNGINQSESFISILKIKNEGL